LFVSVIIPTCRRPRLVLRAIASVLSQTLQEFEVIVVLADEDRETQFALSSVVDDRLRVLPYEGPLSTPAARNRGVQNARGDWVAFLDDDDTWLPDKLRRQSQVAAGSRYPVPIVSCGMLARDEQSERLWPRRLPKRGEPLGDYLFRRRSFLGAGGYLQSSTLFAPRELFLEVPFRSVRPGDDLDWALRAVRRENVGVEFVTNAAGDRPEPLIVWNINLGRPRESISHRWRDSLDWIRQNADLVGPEAYASYLLTWVSLEAARQKAGIRGFWELWREAARHGRPSAVDLIVHLGHWVFPASTLQRLSGWLTGKTVQGKAASSCDELS
jgi:glycosyltransferase involved in cell wall biosynthesis